MTIDIKAYLSVASSRGRDPNRLLTLSARHYHNGAATSLPISRLNQHSSLATRPTSRLAPGSSKVVSRWSVWVRGKAVQCRFSLTGRFGWARPDTGRLQRVFRRRPQTDVVQNQETWFALFCSTPAEVQTDRRPCCLTFSQAPLLLVQALTDLIEQYK